MRGAPLFCAFLVACGAADASDHALVGRDAAEGGSVDPPERLACDIVQPGVVLSERVRETSGLARSAVDAARFWTHNDAGDEPWLYAVAADGSLSGRVRVTGATLVDWEDVEAASCEGQPCLYIADIGDNDGDRDHVTVYRVPEPQDGAAQVHAEPLHARYREGAQDAEALFAGPDGMLYVVTKGRHEDVALYALAPSTSGDTAVLERLRVLFPRPDLEADRVTAASVTPDGRWVAIRTYRTLHVYDAAELTGDGPARPHAFDLSPLGEPQGEGVVILDDGEVWLSSEAEGRSGRPLMSRLQCHLPH